MKLKVHWASAAQITELSLYSELYQNDIPDKLFDVEPLKRAAAASEQDGPVATDQTSAQKAE